MNRIEELLAEHCRDGVEFRSLKGVGTWYGGGTPSKHNLEFWTDGTIPWLSPKDMGKPIVEVTEDHITMAAVKGSATRLVPANSVALVVRSSILDRILPTALIPVPITLNQDMRAVVANNDVMPGYLAHVLRSRGPELLRTVRKTGGSVASLDYPKLLAYKIPVPPLAVQRGIVEILDKMDRLVAELEAELEYRSRQYAHYRDSLLTFAEGEVRSLTFGEAATIVRGGSPRPIQAFLTDSEDGVNWIKIGDVSAGGKYITSTAQMIRPEGAAKSRRVEPGDFVLSNSMSFGRPYIVQIDGCIHDGWLAVKDFTATFNPDFLYHLLRSTAVYGEMVSRAGAGTVQNLNADIVKSLVLPAPTLKEQERIAGILDRFDILVNDLSVGIPAEINARRRQYEYYRDMLLMFEEQAA